MKFSEILERKRSLKSNIVYNEGEEFEVLITPKKIEEALRFLGSYRDNLVTEEDVQMFSSDGEYILRVFKEYNGAVLHDIFNPTKYQ